ncbi:MAG: bis(5'-nucleosyl)-tetraphosphatase (symmetrical) [Myxococcota bacterium]|jgi:bis(5'-nucleosyl)-tetraphosphatase (symmetrical)
MQKIFVGDVQGCGEEFKALAERATATFGSDFELWSVGDLINRGPKNLLALGVMRSLQEDGRGKVVVGNHEIGLLRVWLGLRDIQPKSTYAEILDSPDAQGWLDWIRVQPVVLCDEIEGSRFAMVHAAAHPDWTIDELQNAARRIEARLASRDLADVRALLASDEVLGGIAGSATTDVSLLEDRDALGRLTRCRSIDDAGTWSSSDPGKKRTPWHVEWAKRSHDYGVVYGHWSRQGLHVAPWLRGLDTGCVHHGRGRDGYLTAWLPGAPVSLFDGEASSKQTSVEAFDLPDDRFWKIAALQRYY